MCCFAGAVESVSDTNLFARLTGTGTQILVYQMRFETQEENAMILPLPVATPAREDFVRFISLQKYDLFFNHLDEAFPVIRPPSRGFTDAPQANFADSLAAPKLVVQEVGDFVASFVPTMNDFSRLDPRFVIPRSSWDKIPAYKDYGFAVFQLKNLSGKPHPIAFEFRTRLKDEIFFPTVHIHDGEVHRREKFDHTLYLQNAEFDKVVASYANSHVKDRNTGFVRSKDIAKRYCSMSKTAGVVDADALVHRIKMNGTLDNKDVITPIAARQPGGKGFRLGQVLPFAPVIMGIGGLKWIVNRRNAMLAQDIETSE